MITTDVDNILSKAKELHNVAFDLSQTNKNLGFMRMACVLEHMRKCVTPEQVQA